MAPKLDIHALQMQSNHAERHEVNLAVFKSECTQSTAFLLFALNYLERVTDGLGMPDELEITVDLGPYRRATWRYPGAVGKSLLRFKKADNRWSLAYSSAAVTYRFTNLLSVLGLILPQLGISGDEPVSKVVESFSAISDNEFADLFAVFNVMPVNSVQVLLVDQSKFGRALGISDLDEYARAATDWFIINIMAKGFSIYIPPALVDFAGQRGVAENENAFIAHMKTAYDCCFDTAVARYSDFYFLMPALKAGLITLDNLQSQARRHVSERSPEYIRKLIEMGVDFRDCDAIEAVFQRAAILPDAKKDAVAAELMDILVAAGCSIPRRSYYLQRVTQYPLSEFMKSVVAKHRKVLREAEAQMGVPA
jgi:hypothetical protein